jgi:hypothetical protein
MAVVPLYDEDMCIVHVKKDLDANVRRYEI